MKTVELSPLNSYRISLQNVFTVYWATGVLGIAAYTVCCSACSHLSIAGLYGLDENRLLGVDL